MKRLLQLTTLFAACLLAYCSVQTTQGGDGGATETVNARVVVCDSTIAVNLTSEINLIADIMIFDENYNPVIRKGFCDSAKSIPVDSVITFGKLNGKYNIIIFNRLTEYSLAINSITAGTSIADTITDTLSPSGSVHGNVVCKETEKLYIQVYLSGTSYHVPTDSIGAFQLNAIPQGKYFIEAILSNNNVDSKSNRSVGMDLEIKSSMLTDSVTLFFSK